MTQQAKQQQQQEWLTQWQIFSGDETLFLFQDWTYPQTLEGLRGKSVLEAGCGCGPHTALMVPYAKEIAAVDLNTIELARQKLKDAANVSFYEADIAVMDLGRSFDVVMSLGVVHHTDSPEATVENLKRHVKEGGTISLWVYAQEGNFLVKWGVEPIRKLLIRHLSRQLVLRLAQVITALLYVPVYTLYCLPLPFLPFYEYFGNFRKLSFQRNWLNVFDKLNAPQVIFLSKERVRSWFNDDDFEVVHLTHYKGVSWRITARRKM